MLNREGYVCWLAKYLGYNPAELMDIYEDYVSACEEDECALDLGYFEDVSLEYDWGTEYPKTESLGDRRWSVEYNMNYAPNLASVKETFAGRDITVTTHDGFMTLDDDGSLDGLDVLMVELSSRENNRATIYVAL